jgi:hypothetical protein
MLGFVSERGDVLELVCDAFGRLPPVSATVRSWWKADPFLPSRRGVALGDREDREYLIVAPHLRAFRVETAGSPSKMVLADGTTMWRQVAPGEFLRENQKGFRSPSAGASLLYPAWLVGYEWDAPSRDTHNGRDVLRMHVRRRAADHLAAPQTTPLPGEAEVLVDVELGFLHRLTGFNGGRPYRVVELLDVIFDPPMDEHTFRVDESHDRVIDLSEWKRRCRPSGRLSNVRRVWHSIRRTPHLR